ncbi:hypothetical protein [Aliikangiella sp. IMCC44359]|uniref:hypothetical protein n=1 Tax=Aliikangiella sp. IMCC44359 TaxID=3459125 RepID=UPI00403B0318
MIKDLFEQLKKKLEPTASDFSTNEKAEDKPSSPIGQLTTEKIKAIVAELTAETPLFEEAGFLMEQLEIEIGLIPKIVPQFTQTKEISPEEEANFLGQLNNKQLLKFVLQSLFKASRMKALLESTELYLYGIEISVSAPPSVKTIFKRQRVSVINSDTHH